MATLTDVAAEIHGPEEPELARLWALALSKFQAREGREPATREDWRAVIKEYSQLARKPHGSLPQIIAERCQEAPGGD